MKIFNLASIILAFSIYSFANITITHASDESDMQECLNNFNIDLLDTRSIDLRNDFLHLTEYWSCRAGAENRIDYCQKCNDAPTSGMCKYGFKVFAEILNNIISLKQVSFQNVRDFINADSYILDNYDPRTYNFKDVEKFLFAIAQKNASICSSLNDNKTIALCTAQATRNENLCNNDFCKYTIYYSKAVENNDSSYCNKLKQIELRGMCLGAISGRIELCEQNKEFKYFKVQYCRKIVERNKIERLEKDEQKRVQ